MKRQKFIYHLGTCSGFFSEYINMILAILYCRRKGIIFTIYSSDANFGYEKGWQDYFLPFCEEVYDSFHHTLNHRYTEQQFTASLLSFLRSLKKAFFMRDLGLVKPFVPFSDSSYIRDLKKKYEFSYFMHDIWFDFEHHVDVFDNDGKMTALHEIDHRIWRYNDATACEVRGIIQSCYLPSSFIGIHVRRGDKILESVFYPVERYISIIESTSDLRDVFVATDDYSIVEDLVDKYPNFCFYTNTKPNNRGYQQSEFNSADKVKVKADILTLFADVEILSSSTLFVGHSDSNVDQYVAIRRNGQNCLYVDSLNVKFRPILTL